MPGEALSYYYHSQMGTLAGLEACPPIKGKSRRQGVPLGKGHPTAVQNTHRKLVSSGLSKMDALLADGALILHLKINGRK